MKNTIVWALATALVLVLSPSRLFAHCDTLDGPVVKAARKALEMRQVAYVLPWVHQRDELEVQAAFDRALEVRALSPQAQALADTYFFETVVRLHRAGEGKPYAGLKPAGEDPGSAIPAAEQAIAERSSEPLVTFLTGSLAMGVVARLQTVLAAQDYQPAHLSAARRYVAAYTEFIEYIDRLYKAIVASSGAGEGEDVGLPLGLNTPD